MTPIKNLYFLMTPHLTDWGQYGPTSLMEQRPITYALRTLCPAERNHAQPDKGGAAVILSLKKFHQYLYRQKFKTITDHQPF